MTVDGVVTTVLLVIAALTVIYLFTALVFPERFDG
ncbi:potassium-transporting ATPase subunit F [Gordonia jinhuaensis]|nr:potassium-transporting ATPase subunit F [Gordonia jinhuaensis]